MQFDGQGSVMVMLDGQEMDGGGTGRTSTLNEHVAVPQALEAVQVTAWLPKGNTLPGGGTQVTVVPAGLTTGAGYVTTAEFEQVRRVWSGGH
jgi:hypothetical protein